MSNAKSLLRAASHPGTTEGVTSTAPVHMCRAEWCEVPIHIGLFFDGTGNNQDWTDPALGGETHLARRKDSNVARLSRAYPDDPLRGYYRAYIPGVGTPFDKIGESGTTKLGMGFGAGGDARIVYGLLHVLNSMHDPVNKRSVPMIEADTVKALSRNGWLPLPTGTDGSRNPLSVSDQYALDEVGMKDQGGLLTVNGFSYRTKFLRQKFDELGQKIRDAKYPKLKEVFIDVFGFSRGAAQARVFCNWLDECFEGDTLAGVTAHIRFLGIFDTVAAVGLGPAASRWANGHHAWGDPENLRISPRVRHCEHYVAMHEQRESFPLEDVQTPDGAMPPRCRQFRFPGMHSDVGGGYLPREQGKNECDEASKLASVPLNMMYEAAVAAYVPLDKDLAFSRTEDWDPFEMSDQLKADYQAFIQANGTGVRAIADCLIDILAWRYYHRDDYEKLPFMTSANLDDRRDLIAAHRIFLEDIEEIGRANSDLYHARESVDTAKLSLRGTLFRLSEAEKWYEEAYRAKASIPQERRDILALIVKRRPSGVERAFFSTYCHDSYAGFKPFPGVRTPLTRNAPWESGGYLRFRTRYAGESLRLATLESQAASTHT
jgi:hypothetical protein